MKYTHKYIIYLFIIFLLSCTNVYASCTDSELNKFNKVKNDYTVTYEINKETKTYDLYFKAPMPQNFYYRISSTNGKLNCEKADDNTMKCIGFRKGLYEVLVVGITSECNDILKTIKIDLPKYNTLADDPLCEGIEEFVLCNPAYDKDIDYEDFVSRVNTYKKNHSNDKKEENDYDIDEQVDKQKENNKNEFITSVMNYIKNHLVEIIIVIIFIILLLITMIITVKSLRKSRRLE